MKRQACRDRRYHDYQMFFGTGWYMLRTVPVAWASENRLQTIATWQVTFAKLLLDGATQGF